LNQHTIEERLRQDEVLLLDSAMGTELQRRGVETAMPLWSTHGLLAAPELVREIHVANVQAGAEVLTANTFRSNLRAMRAAGLEERAADVNHLAVRLAREARERAAERPVWVAGSIAPVEECYQPALVPDDAELRAEHRLMAEWLAEAGVDLFLIETMNTVREALAALEAANATGRPSCVSFVCGLNGRLLSGEPIAEAVEALTPLRPLALLINCTPPRQILAPLRALAACSPVPIGAYAHLGVPEETLGWEFSDFSTPDEYAAHAREWQHIGARIIGGCCGTTPEHLAAVCDALRSG
jgi:S-methylmethionine-dependent homocysteine/selenocysteine methylase